MIALRNALIIVLTISGCLLPNASAVEQTPGPKKRFHEVYARELDKQTRELFSFGFKCRFVLDYDNPMCVKCCAHDGQVPMKGKLDSNCECIDAPVGTLTKQLNGEQAEPNQATQGRSPPPPPPPGGQNGPSPFPMAPPNAAANLKPVPRPPSSPSSVTPTKAPWSPPPPPLPPPSSIGSRAPAPPPPPPPMRGRAPAQPPPMRGGRSSASAPPPPPPPPPPSG